jgi:hypothetical protein
MLASLMETPENDNDWLVWGFANKQQNALIRQAIQLQYGTTLTEYVLYPIDFNNPVVFLQNNQLTHQAFLGILGLQSHDIEFSDFSNPAQLEAWIYINYKELYDASTKLGVAN